MISKPPSLAPDTARTRSLRAWPILLLTMLMVRASLAILVVNPYTDRFYAQKRFESGGISVPILHEFYGIKILDRVLGQIIVFFNQMQTRIADPLLYTQSMVFLMECMGIYALMLLETSRRRKQALMFQPMVACFLAQLATGGAAISLYFFFLYVHRPLDEFRALDGNRALAILPSIIIGSYPSTFLSYFHPTFEGRHWWCWLWQLYPIWSGIIYAVLSRATQFSSRVQKKVSTAEQALSIAKFTLAVIGAVNTVIYWYASWGLGVSIKDAFIPKYLVHTPTDYAVAFRTVIQYDYICVQGALIIWLVLSFRDLKAAGLMHMPWSRIIVVGAVVGSIFGVGNIVSLGWIKREEVLTSWSNNKKAGKQEKTR